MSRFPWLAGAMVGLLAGAAFASDSATRAAPRQAIEVRAACITHEGADLPPITAIATVIATKSQAQTSCSAAELDGTVCETLEGAEARACRTREIAIWDGVLDRLSGVRSTTPRLASARGAIAAFRTYRNRSCTAYRAVAVNPSDPSTVEACRLSETARFAQRIYEAVYSP